MNDPTADFDEASGQPVGSVLDDFTEDRIALLNQRVATLEQSNRENSDLVEELLAQATADFEERSWLRRLFDDVQHFDPASMARTLKFNLVSPLRNLLSARCVRLLPTTDPEDGHQLPHIVVGESPLTADESRRLVDDIHDLTRAHRFLFNRTRHPELAAIVPDPIANVIAVGVVLDERVRGWLLAFDKIASAGPECIDEIGRSSELEFGTIECSLFDCAVSSLAARLRLLEATRPFNGRVASSNRW